MRRRVFTVLLSALMIVSMSAGIFGAELPASTASAAETIKTQYSSMVRGTWVPYCDFKTLGLYNQRNVSTYTARCNTLMRKLKAQGINTVYFHARSFDDAAWCSNTFKASRYLVPSSVVSKYRNSRQAYMHYLGYDPFKVFVRRAAAYSIKVEAYMNPYRVTSSRFLDPKSPYTRQRIYRAVQEMKAGYNVSGIHYDDYFYNSGGSYVYTTKSTRYSKYVSGRTSTCRGLSSKSKRVYCNYMIRGTYGIVHSSKYPRSSSFKTLRFGVSSQGNYKNCMASGADIDTWLRVANYVDYLAPQIYWTDRYVVSGKSVKMFSSRLSLFMSKNKLNKPIYVGLALYRSGQSNAYDKGWAASTQNIRYQVKVLTAKGADGYALYSAKYIAYPSSAVKKELSGYHSLIFTSG
ncbi:MAG: family 10 glycosylhydrolase [Anaerovoracaceae bacterium]|jgi:uncharacterized lipoprotein YddW (UPF0748 family)